MNSFASPAWALPVADTPWRRLDGILETGFAPDAPPLRVALPAAHARPRGRFPLLVLVRGAALFGSAVEMTRLLASSREARACIVADAEVEPAALGAVIAHCRRSYRVDPDEVALFAGDRLAPWLLRAFAAGIPGATRCIVATTAAPATLRRAIPPGRASSIAWTTREAPADAPGIHWKAMPEVDAASLAVPGLLHGQRTFWGRGHRYAQEVLALCHPLAPRLTGALAPVLRPFTRRRTFAPEAANPHVLRSSAMQRDFEVFASLPASAQAAPARRHPAIIALDANGGFATVAETAARLAADGAIEEAVVVGVGGPRAQGDLEFGFRRFEELSPPADPGYAWDDGVGRFFRSLFALRGQDARVQLGKAPQFHAFVVDELLPRLLAQLPIDPAALTLLGHSAAGTFVAFAAAQPRSPFSGFACLSPGVAIGDHWMLRHARAPAGARIYTAIGSAELDNRFNLIAGIPRAPEWVDALRATGLPVAPCEVLDGETHTTVYPRAVAQALCALLRRAR